MGVGIETLVEMSVATAVGKGFQKNEISVENKLAKILPIFKKIDVKKLRGY